MKAFAPVAVLAGLLTAGALPALVPAQSSVVTGHLLGHDGKPMVKAHVHLTRPPGARMLLTVDVSPSGKFRLTTKETGALLLQFTGAHHRRKFVPLMIRKPAHIELDVRLRTHEYVEDLSGVRVIGDFNGFSLAKAAEMVKQPDGTYSLEVATSSPSVSYELANIEKNGRAVNGTDSDAFEYDGEGNYRSILHVSGGRVTIRFDPKRLLRSEAPAGARFADPNSVEARLLSISEDSRAREEAYRDAVQRSEQEGKSEESVHLDWSAAAAALSRRLEGERDPFLREALRLSLLDLVSCGGDLPPETIRTAIAGVPPGSPLWSYNPLLIEVVVRYAQPGAAAADSDPVEQIIAGRPEPESKSLMLFVAVWKARELRQNERANRYYQRLVSDYPNSLEAKAVAGLGSESKIQAGKPVPPFSFPALDDPDTRYTPEALRGKVYLLDFWATWCGPCVGEMGTIHKAYEKYKGQGFEVVSLSLDGRPDDVRKFRKGKWPMPWLHTFVTDGFLSETAKTFEVGAIPKPILVDGNGVIFATWEDLSGPALERTLDRVFEKKK